MILFISQNQLNYLWFEIMKEKWDSNIGIHAITMLLLSKSQTIFINQIILFHHDNVVRYNKTFIALMFIWQNPRLIWFFLGVINLHIFLTIMQ